MEADNVSKTVLSNTLPAVASIAMNGEVGSGSTGRKTSS
jgi:hypothetical protein